MGLCVFSLPISLLMIERIYIYIYNYLCYYHHQIGSMNYYPLFRVSSWNNGVCCMSFCILIGKYPCLIQVCKLLLQQTPRILRLSPPPPKKKKKKKKNIYLSSPQHTHIRFLWWARYQPISNLYPRVSSPATGTISNGSNLNNTGTCINVTHSQRTTTK